MSILLLAGSPAIPSRSTRLLNHVGEQLEKLGHRQSRLHILDLPATALLQADASNHDIKLAKVLVEQAEAVVVATPVYKAAYSGLLKTFLDLLPQDGFAGKLILPIATGGSQSHMLALDYALRPVLSALGAAQVLPSIYATDAQINWANDKGLVLDPFIARRVAAGVEHLSASLQALHAPAVANFASVPFSQVRCSV